MKFRARPLSIKLFATAYLGQAAVDLANNFYNIEALRRTMVATTQTPIDPAYMPAIFVVRIFFVLAMLSWLWLRASNPAKWIIIVLLIPKLTQIGDAWSGLELGRANAFFWLATVCLYLLAILMLFLPGARYWFATKGGTVKGNAQVFD